MIKHTSTFFLRSSKIFFLVLITGILLLIGYIQTEEPKRIEMPKPSLKDVVEKAMSGSKGEYAIVIRNFKTGENYILNDHKVFDTGSLYKLWVMAAVYREIQKGNLTKREVLSKDIAALNAKFNIASDSAEFIRGTITLTVADALNQMIVISHNYAALLLTEKIKLSTVANFLKSNGFNESSVGVSGDSPVSTASDIALFFEKLYKNQLTDSLYSNEMIDLLKKQQLNEGLPKYLPDKSRIANKTGDIGWLKHDAGIVFLQEKEKLSETDKENKGDYLIVVMSESDYPPGAQERIANISKAVYDYFQRQMN